MQWVRPTGIGMKGAGCHHCKALCLTLEKMCQIHGGDWIYGSSLGNHNSPVDGAVWDYDGSHIARKYQVVVVAGNYRLDSLGWLALEELMMETPERSAEARCACAN